MPLVPGGALAAPALPPAFAAAGPALRPGEVWVALEARGGYSLGQQLAVLPAGAQGLGERAVIIGNNGEHVAIGAMAPADAVAVAAGDARTLPVRFDAQGSRRRTFGEAIACMTEDALPGGFSTRGPRSTLTTIKASTQLMNRKRTPGAG